MAWCCRPGHTEELKMSAVKVKSDVAMVASIEGLRSLLFDEIKSLRAGTTDTTRARTVSSLAGRVIDTARVQMQAQKLWHQMGKDDKRLTK